MNNTINCCYKMKIHHVNLVLQYKKAITNLASLICFCKMLSTFPSVFLNGTIPVDQITMYNSSEKCHNTACQFCLRTSNVSSKINNTHYLTIVRSNNLYLLCASAGTYSNDEEETLLFMVTQASNIWLRTTQIIYFH